MSTHSVIAIVNKESGYPYHAIYCHSDGYPSYQGAMLLSYYNSEAMASKLVALGDLSVVRERVAPRKGEIHNFSHPIRSRDGDKLGGVTTAYHRDRGEPLKIESLKTEDDLKHYADCCGASYIYLYDVARKCWLVASGLREKSKFVDLTLIEDNP